jgi:hypothetical protein
LSASVAEILAAPGPNPPSPEKSPAAARKAADVGRVAALGPSITAATGDGNCEKVAAAAKSAMSEAFARITRVCVSDRAEATSEVELNEPAAVKFCTADTSASLKAWTGSSPEDKRFAQLGKAFSQGISPLEMIGADDELTVGPPATTRA